VTSVLALGLDGREGRRYCTVLSQVGVTRSPSKKACGGSYITTFARQ
jgi:hypothetical protein